MCKTRNVFSIQLKEIAERNQVIDQVNNVKMDQPPLHVTSTIRDSFGFALLSSVMVVKAHISL